jgi:hypothetical protein
MGSNHLILAAATTALDKLQKIPKDFWLKGGLAIAAIIIAFIIIQKVLKINKFVLGGVIFVAGGLMWFNWIYHRTEPKFLTPLVDRIAPFFPSAGAYDTKQATTPDEAKKK